jgi:hypothetical protein
MTHKNISLLEPALKSHLGISNKSQCSTVLPDEQANDVWFSRATIFPGLAPIGVSLAPDTDSSPVILSEAKNLCVAGEILRFAQNDRHDDPEIVKLTPMGLAPALVIVPAIKAHVYDIMYLLLQIMIVCS